MTQSFFARLLAKEDLNELDPAKGRFRSWLLRACTNFLKNDHNKASAKKRRPEGGLRSLNFHDAESRYTREPAHVQTPEALYTRRWALALLERVLGRLESDVESNEKKRKLLERLKPLISGEADGESYARVGAELSMTAGAVRVAALRSRKRYKKLLYEEIERTVDEPDEIAQEIADLFPALSL